MFQWALPSRFPQLKLRHRPLQGWERAVTFMGGRGFYASEGNSVLSYSSLNSLSKTFHAAHSGTPARRGAMEEHVPA